MEGRIWQLYQLSHSVYTAGSSQSKRGGYAQNLLISWDIKDTDFLISINSCYSPTPSLNVKQFTSIKYLCFKCHSFQNKLFSERDRERETETQRETETDRRRGERGGERGERDHKVLTLHKHIQ